MIKVLLYITLLAIVVSANARGEVLDKIIVVVNDEVITQRELDRVILPIYNQYKSVYGEEDLPLKLDEARSKILQQMIMDKLILGRAKKMEVIVKDQEIDEEIERVKTQFASDSEFEAALRSQGLSETDLKRIYREKLMVKKLVDAQVRSRIKISPLETENYYNNHLDLFMTPQEVRARSILLKITPERGEAETLEFAKTILARLREGSDFKELARLYSDGPHASEGGDMGYVKKGDMIERIDDALFSLQEGDISDIVKTDIGFHIFKVEERKSPGVMTFNEARPRIEEMLYAEKFRAKFENWIEELKKNAYIAIK